VKHFISDASNIFIKTFRQITKRAFQELCFYGNIFCNDKNDLLIL
jgi:hypothetical protein